MEKETIQNGIWSIPDGRPFIFENMTIQTSNSNNLIVTGWTNTIHFENINREQIAIELDKLKTKFHKLKNESVDLKDIIQLNRLQIEFHICYDSGKSGIGICSEVEGMVNWFV